MFALSLVFVCIIFAAVGQIALKSGMREVGEIRNIGGLLNFTTLFHIFTNVRVFAGLLLYAISAVLWLGALSTLKVSTTYPLLSLSYVLTAIISFVFLKENLSLLNWLGILLVAGGSFLILRTSI